ncbi:putative uncharacterized protein DDB_G0282133 [Galleria mellonella]|uniref:Uncharacterized protein n=1 Tax=Galleria mellonella TaxID=7137 RepID=A0ABM3MYZ0_GALME|nr:putative uncharacterized protein DDB_G0282133 [Galleria mellonella]
MRWFIFHCILLGCTAIILAKTESTRPKRDLAFLKGLYKSIFGFESPKNTLSSVHLGEGENYKIYRVPEFKKPGCLKSDTAFDKPFLGADAVSTIVGSYLGTKTDNETLSALEGIKNLMQSGILETKGEAVQKIMATGVLPPNMRLTPPTPCSKFLHSSDGYNTGVFSLLMKICQYVANKHKHGYIYPVVVSKPITFIPGSKLVHVPGPNVVHIVNPVLVPAIAQTPSSPKYSYKLIHRDGQITTYTAQDDQNVTVTNTYGSLSSLPESYEISENTNKKGPVPVTSVKVHNFPTTVEVISSNVQESYNNVVPSASTANNYPYKQIHKDSSTTTLMGQSGIGISELKTSPVIPEVISDRIRQVATATMVGRRPNHVIYAGDNMVTTHFLNQPNVNVIDNNPRHNAVSLIQSSKSHQDHNNSYVPNNLGIGTMEINKGITSTMQVAKNIHNNNNENGGLYSYKMIHKDGSVTTYSGSGVSEEKAGFGTTNIKDDQVKPIEGIYQIPASLISKNENVNANIHDDRTFYGNSGSYLYKIIHKDGSVTNYVGNALTSDRTNEINILNITPKPYMNMAMVNVHPENIEEIHTTEDQNNSTEDFGTFSYKPVHKDGTVTNYIESGTVVKSNGEIPFSTASHDEVNKEVSSTAQVHMNIHNLGIFPALKIDNTANENGGLYSYKMIHKDGSVTTYSGSGTSEEKGGFETTNIKDDQVKPVEGIHRIPVYPKPENANKNIHGEMTLQSNTGLYPYKTIHEDGPITNYSGNELLSDKTNEINILNITSKPYMNMVMVNTHPVNIKEPYTTEHQNNNNNGDFDTFSYKTVHRDGTVTTYAGNKTVEKTNSEIPFSTMSHDKHVAGHSPFYVQQINNDKVQKVLNLDKNFYNNEQPSPFSYKNTFKDGSVMSYSENGQAVKINKGNLTVNNNRDNIYNVESLGANLDSNRNTGGFYSYKVVHSDGSVTSFPGIDEIGDRISSVSDYQRYYVNNQITNFKENNPEINSVSENKQKSEITINVEPINTTEQDIEKGHPYFYKAGQSDGSMAKYTGFAKKRVSSIMGSQASNMTKVSQLHMNFYNNENPSLFSDKNIYNDESVPSYSEKVQLEKINNGNSIVNDYNIDTNVNSNANRDGFYSYKVVHSDGSVTSFPGAEEIGDRISSFSDYQGYYDNNQIVNFKENNPESDQVSENKRKSEIAKKRVSSIMGLSIDKSFNDTVLYQTLKKITSNEMDNPAVKVSTGSYSFKLVHKDGPASNFSNNREMNNRICTEVNNETVVNGVECNPHLNQGVVNSTDVSSEVSKQSSVLFPQPVNSRYVYKQIKPNSPQQFTVNVTDVSHSDMKVSVDDSLSKHPIVVADDSETYSYTQKREDGSSLNIKQIGKKDVKVNIKQVNRNRGDIPDAFN